MYKDPDTTWEGEFPYDALAPAGITPHSSMRELRASKRYFTKNHQIGKVHRAYTVLKEVQGRLFVDFFLYRTGMQPGAGPGAEEGADG